MSFSESPGRGRLFIEGPPAGKIEIIDGAFNRIAEGTRELVRDDLAEGIYTVRWLGPAGEEEQNVRLFAGAELRLRGGFAGIGPGYEEIDAAAIISTLAPGATPADPASMESAIDILVAADGQVQSDPARSLRLLALDGTEMEIACTRPGKEARPGASCRIYRVAPGAYRLRCHGADHRWVEQIVHAFPGRRTMMFMNYGRAYEMRIRQGERTRTSLRGIDPAASLAVSIPLSDEERPARCAFPLHESLLHGLTRGAALVDESLIGELRRPETDPYAKLYAAILLLHRSLAPPDPSREQRGLVAPEQVRDWAGEIVASMDASSCSDLDCLRWRLGLDSAGRGALACPPMLAHCWGWAVERSVDDPGAVPATPELIAAADALSTYLPWLVWNAVDARQATSTESFSADRLAAVVVAIEEGIAQIRDRLGDDGNELLLAGGGHADLPLGLSDASLRLVDDLERLQWTVRETNASLIDPADIIRHLGVPAESLLHKANQALDEIQHVDFTLRSTLD